MVVAVLDKKGKPLMPCTEKRARLLLTRGRARIHRVMPFVIRIVDKEAKECAFQEIEIKIDPGSKVTGVGLVRKIENGGIKVLNLIEIVHRGLQISQALTARRQMRRRRRGNLRYRAPRFLNRRNKLKGWLAPSLQHRIDTIMAWVYRLSQWMPLSACSMELVRFDMQKMENPEIANIEYQQGTLFGCEVREYLLEKWKRKCAYCDVENVPLNIDHVHPRAHGGSNRISNLTLACISCNERKGATALEEFLAKKKERLIDIKKQLKLPLKDAAAVNSTRLALFNALKLTGMAVNTGSGSQTKYNRTSFGLSKTHALDAVCVGEVDSIIGWQKPTLTIKAMGRGSYQRTRLTASGFPRGYLMRTKKVHGFQTGDMVRAIVPSGKKMGTHTGRVAVRSTGNFNIQTSTGVIQGISFNHCQLIQRADGYHYHQRAPIQLLNTLNKQEERGFLPDLKIRVSASSLG